MKDRITVLLGVGAIVVAIVGGTCSTNARISDLGARIDRIDARLAGRVDGLDARLRVAEVALAKLDEGFTALEERFTALEERFTALEQGFAALEERFTALEQLLLPTRAAGDQESGS